MTSYMVEVLAKKRAEIAGEIVAAQGLLRKLADDLSHVDATLRIIAPDVVVEDIGPVFRPPSDWSKRGEMSRVMLDILRTARAPMTSREIASQMIITRGLAADTATLNLMAKRCSTALRGLANQGLLQWEEGAAGFEKLWSIAT